MLVPNHRDSPGLGQSSAGIPKGPLDSFMKDHGLEIVSDTRSGGFQLPVILLSVADQPLIRKKWTSSLHVSGPAAQIRR